MEKEQKQKIVDREGRYSVILNTLLFGIKLWAGMVTGSVALMADAWHTLSDSLSSLIMIFSMKLSRREADPDHPFGHERYELIASLAIGILLSVVAFDFLVESIKKMFTDSEVVFGTLAITVTIISIITKELLARYSFWGERQTGYKVLKAEAWHHRSDAISSAVILVGIFLKPYVPLVDELLGLAVSGLLFHAAYEVISDSVSPLLGRSPDGEIISKVALICAKHTDRDCAPHHFHIHEYGSHRELTFHIRLAASKRVEEAHDEITAIEKEIFSEMNINATIHMEPK